MNHNSTRQDLDLDDEIEVIVDEFTDRLNRGDKPNVEDWARAHPRIAKLLREVLTPLVALHGSSSPEHDTPHHLNLVPEIDEQFGEYELHREIGRGGMGIVYEAMHRQLGRRVALKILANHLHDEVFVRRFQLEARAAAGLHHQHIVPVYETGQNADLHYIAMQYIEGRSLDRTIRQMRHSREVDCENRHDTTSLETQAKIKTSIEAAPAIRPEGEFQSEETASRKTILKRSDSDYFLAAARIALQAADALEHAHCRGVLHRDIKPSNLLLDEQNNVWVTDFGLAKLEDDNLTQTGDIVGTLRYMAAERFSGLCDARSDVYGLGVTIYELLTLRPAFDQTDRLQLIRQVTNDDPPRPRQVDASVPRDLDTIVAKAVSREPDQRYQTARELAEDLRRFVDDEPILASQLTVRERIGRWYRRNPVPAALAALLVISVIAGSGLFAWQFAKTLRGNEALIKLNRELVAANEAEQAAREEAERNFAVNAAVTKFLVESFRRPDPAIDGRTVTLASQLDSAFEELKKDTRVAPVTRGALLNAIGITYRELGLIEQAIEALTMSDEHFAKELSNQSERRIDTQSQLGFAYVGAGQFEKAIEVLQPVVDNARVALDEHSKVTSLATNHLAIALRAAGQAEKARQLLEPVYEYQLKNVANKSEETLQTENNLALVFQSLGKLDRAIELFEESMKGYTQLFGETDPRVLMVKSNLAVAYLSIGQHKLALPLVEETLHHRRSILGEDHAETLGAVNNLAGVYMMSGQVDKAVETLAELLPKMQSKLGLTHPNTLSIQYNLAGGYLWLEQPERALPLFVKSWEQMKTSLGPDHPTTQKCYQHIGRANEELGNLDEAVRIYQAVLDAEQKRDPVQPTAIAKLLESLGNLMIQQEREVEAEALLRDALAIWEEQNPGQWQPEVTRGLLGESLYDQARFQEAAPYLLESHQKLSELRDQLPIQRREEILDDARERLDALQESSRKTD